MQDQPELLATKCVINLYENSYQYESLTRYVPKSEIFLFKQIATMLANQYNWRPTNADLWAEIRDEDNNAIYRVLMTSIKEVEIMELKSNERYSINF